MLKARKRVRTGNMYVILNLCFMMANPEAWRSVVAKALRY